MTPNQDYGSWKTLSLGFYRKEKENLTCFMQLGAFSRKQGDSALKTVGAYKDRLENLYIYTAVSAGANSEYLPKFRFDHDFNIKLGAEKRIVWILRGSYILYFDVHIDG